MAMGDLYRWGDSRDVPDTLNALLRYREGFTVNLSSTFNNRSQGGAGFEILGTEGTLRIGSGSVTFSRERLSENNDWIVEAWPTALEQQYRASLEAPDRTRPPEPEVIKAKGRGDTLLHLESFMHSVRTREPVVEDVWKGHRAAACAHMINSSAERGALVRWDFEQEERQV
jgi:predicted dehydrogenase